ncbi:hypothetical protein [Duganella levis]|uniref:Anti-sigma factor n=1 Tax=Duganella levis TaxID=2692169 RepID=A0ABW9VZX7_9BURK|nr:hypothetical protein [Duganella levis]MYN27257.1 hypothetical protein [Duganella levis]
MDEQQRLLERLPDYLTGHVTGEDAERIAALLATDAEWQAQAAMLDDVRGAIAAQIAAMDSDTGLDELHRRIAAAPAAEADTAASPQQLQEPQSAQPQRPAKPPRNAWWQRLFDLRLVPQFTPAIVASLVAVCAAQGWMLGHAPDTDVVWRDAPLNVAAPAANLQVRFAADASLAQVEAALLQAHARIVSGPQGGQRYLLQAEDATAALAQLRANAVVAEASIIPPGPAAPQP